MESFIVKCLKIAFVDLAHETPVEILEKYVLVEEMLRDMRAMSDEEVDEYEQALLFANVSKRSTYRELQRLFSKSVRPLNALLKEMADTNMYDTSPFGYIRKIMNFCKDIIDFAKCEDASEWFHVDSHTDEEVARFLLCQEKALTVPKHYIQIFKLGDEPDIKAATEAQLHELYSDYFQNEC
jgi:hypothetical protein